MNVEIEENGEVIKKVWVNGRRARRVWGSQNYSRQVFKVSNLIIKFDGVYDAVSNQNKEEIVNFKKIQASDRKYFAEILFYGTIKNRLCVIQKAIEKYRRPPSKEDKKILKSLKTKYYFLEDVCSKFTYNVFLTKDSFKIFDLGHYGR